jgi:RNA polymerase sigma-70 factor (ECF subfamily)
MDGAVSGHDPRPRGQSVTPPSEEPERELVAACVQGDAAAWRRFHARYHPIVLRAAERALARRTGDPGDLAQDVAGDVFAELVADDHATLARFEGRSSLSTWLCVLTRRRASRVLRRRRPGSLPEGASLEAAEPSPSDLAHVQERQDLVRAELESLAVRDRLALQLFYEGQRSYKEVAAALDLPPSRIGTLLARARQRLAKALGASDGSP